MGFVIKCSKCGCELGNQIALCSCNLCGGYKGQGYSVKRRNDKHGAK
jgi:hypothetical protein